MARRTGKPRDPAKERAWRRTPGGRITKLGPYSSAVVLTSLSILQLVNDDNAYLPVNFSPRVYPEKRDGLKRLIKSPPGT
jgi:hypothetical protein